MTDIIIRYETATFVLVKTFDLFLRQTMYSQNMKTSCLGLRAIMKKVKYFTMGWITI